MNEIELAAQDLNLLATLDVLLRAGSVTRAARQLGRTPSAVSHSLARARALFDDPLLVREGHRMTPTPRAEELAPRLERALAGVGQLLTEPAGFDPATSTRRFSLACPDLLAPALPRLLAALARRAPNVGLDVVPQVIDPAAELLRGAADVAVGALPPAGHALRTRRLGSVRWAVLARRGHPAGERLTRARWMRWPHITVRTGAVSRSVVGEAIAAAGLERRVGMTVNGFLVAPLIVAESDLFFTAPREVLARVAKTLRLRVYKPPIAIPDIPAALLWTERLDNDPGVRWFRELVAEVVQDTLRERVG